MISPKDWTPLIEVTITPQKIEWEMLSMNFHCLAYVPLQEKHPPCQTSGSLPTLSLYKSLIYFSQKKLIFWWRNRFSEQYPTIGYTHSAKIAKNRNFLTIVLSFFCVSNIVSPISDRRKRRPSSEAATSLAPEIKPNKCLDERVSQGCPVPNWRGQDMFNHVLMLPIH